MGLQNEMFSLPPCSHHALRAVRLRHLQYSIGTSATKVKAVARQVASELELPRVRALLADVARCDREVWREAVALHPQMLARLWSGTLPLDRDVRVRDS